MTYPRRVAALVVGLTALLFACSAPSAPTHRYPPLPHPLFDTPIKINGSFGDHRSNHFHAGLDLGVGGVVGLAVHAPADADLRRVRASGVGYGRSIYLETADHRLLVFAHLDAFAEPLASYVAAAQDSSGQYEQDLWPAVGRFAVHAGDVIGWAGRSGTGNPHLHVEIRDGDMALHPLLSGYTTNDTSTPRIERVTFAPLDDSSFAGAASKPQTLVFGTRDTIAATGWGRLRVIVEAVDAETDGTFDVAPWRVRVTNGSEWVQVEFDSVSWATDMTQSDFVYDRGRYTARGKTSLVLASPLGVRPRVVSASTPEPAEAGVVTLDASHPAATLVIETEDLAGHRSSRTVRLKAQRPSTPRAAPPAASAHIARLTADGASSGRLALPTVGRVEVPPGALFERTLLTLTPGGPSKSTAERRAVGAQALVRPSETPLRAAVTVSLVFRGAPVKRVGLYRADGDDWEYIGDEFDSAAHTIGGATRHLGRFALFRDIRAPIARLHAPSRTVAPGPYSKWAIEAPLTDQGSGVDARATYFVIDGHRMPSEWDSVIGVLRWRPLRAPAKGHHTAAVVAVDRAGNKRRVSGTFVIQ